MRRPMISFLTSVAILENKNIQLIKGVALVRVHKTKNEDITRTTGYREAMDDLEHDREYHVDSVDDIFKQILG